MCNEQVRLPVLIAVQKSLQSLSAHYLLPAHQNTNVKKVKFPAQKKKPRKSDTSTLDCTDNGPTLMFFFKREVSF